MDAKSTPMAAQLRERTKQFSLRIIRLSKALTRTEEARIIRRQIVRCGTAIGANYRAVGRARSHKEFVAKLGIVIEEADETVYWLELLIAGAIVPAKRLEQLLDEANQLLAIFCASMRTARRCQLKSKATKSPQPATSQ